MLTPRGATETGPTRRCNGRAAICSSYRLAHRRAPLAAELQRWADLWIAGVRLHDFIGCTGGGTLSESVEHPSKMKCGFGQSPDAIQRPLNSRSFPHS
jgi:hypothetical protein